MRPQARYRAQAEDRVLAAATTLRNEEPNWFGEPKDLIAIVIAALAFILSLVTISS